MTAPEHGPVRAENGAERTSAAVMRRPRVRLSSDPCAECGHERWRHWLIPANFSCNQCRHCGRFQEPR